MHEHHFQDSLLRGYVLVFTNIFVLPAVYLTVKNKQWAEFFVLINIFWISSTYHLCDSFNFCIFSYQAHYWLDHFFAFISFIVLAIYCMNFRNKEYKYLTLLTFSEITLLAYIKFGINLKTMSIIMILVGILYIVRWLYGEISHYRLYELFLSIILVGLGLILFIFFNKTKESYWYIHGVWHILIFIAAYFVLEIKKTPETNIQNNSHEYHNYNKPMSEILLDTPLEVLRNENSNVKFL